MTEPKTDAAHRNMVEQLVGEIEARIATIEEDSRFQDKPAQVQVNAPLALIQVGMKGELCGLRWVLGKLANGGTQRPMKP